MQPKITLIGAGSVVFAKQLIADIIQSPELSDATICLMDIDPTRLKVADIMARRMVTKLKSTVRIESTLNQRKAVQDARYVICTIQVGGYKPGTVIDFDIPKKYGLRQTIADTLGVGGVFRALRTIPVINGIARDIAEVGAPGCLLLNYTNPMAMNCRGVDRAVGIPHVGLCHSVQGTSKQLAKFAGLPYEDVSYLVAGINHMAFFLKFEYKGQDAYPLLFKLLDDPHFHEEKVRFEMMRRVGYFVTESSEHQSEYTPYFIHHGDKIVKQFDIPIDEYIRRCISITETWHKTEKELLGGDNGDIQIPERSHEYGSYIIRARETNKPVVIYGNVPNHGLITNLPDGACVEVPCLIDAQGIQPTVIGDLPPQLAALCRTNINVQELTVEAALSKKREHIYHAVMLDPHTSAQLPLDKIWAMCDEVIAAHQKVGLLGEFEPVVKNTGRSYAGLGDRVTARLATASILPPKTWSDFDLKFEVENPADHSQEVAFTLSNPQNAIKSQSFRLKIGPGKKIIRKLTLTGGKVPSGKFSVELAPLTPNVFCHGLDFEERKTLHPNESGQVNIPVTLSGFPAGEIQLSREKKGLRLHVRISDSNIRRGAAHKSPWEASCIELFFTPANGGTITQLFVLPQPRKTAPLILNQNQSKAKVLTAKQEIDKLSYTIDVLLPYETVNVKSASADFLFDFIANLNALGDAHSGGRTSMNGRFDSSNRSDHYAYIAAV
jgi:alpha-galactosidase/6-phospho-beta-glucosidase family protein